MVVDLSVDGRRQLMIGLGAIGPKTHVVSGEYDWDLVKKAVYDLAVDSSLYKRINSVIPTQCGDGRTTKVIGPSAIGGTFSLVIGDRLGPNKIDEEDYSAKDHAVKLYQFLQSKGLIIGGHIDDNAHSPACGCGGEDRLADIVSLIVNSPDGIRTFIENLTDTASGERIGIKVPDEVHQSILAKARSIDKLKQTSHPYITNGADLRDAMAKVAGGESLDTLHGSHKEIAAVLDFRLGYALDRDAFSNRYDGLVQTFYVNIACLKKSAEILYEDLKDRELAFFSSVYYNIAATAVLSDDSLEIVTLI